LTGLLAPGGVVAARQPIVRVRDGSVVGWESLARTPQGLGPLAALALAEEHGLRLELELACIAAAVADGPAPEGTRLFLNTSPALLLDDRFAALVPQLPAHVLEITEHEPVHDYAPLRERLQAWQETGTLVAIDDVGAGYATMAHVVRLSPAFLKIDRSLVAGLHVEREQRAIVAALAAFAAQVGASCVAEGVELSVELDVLADLGVDLVQGYLIARPGPGWPEPADTVRRGGAVPVLAGPSKPFSRMCTSLDAATAPEAAADAVCRYLFELRRLLPSVYLMRSGRLRCLARKGQWQVLDGLPSGVGITGEAYALKAEVLAADVDVHPTYRAAVGGVRAEMAVPVLVHGEVIGVLNADCLTTLTDADAAALRTCAELLGDRLGLIGTGLEGTSALQELSRLARQTSGERDLKRIAKQTVESAVTLSNLDTAALFLTGPDGVVLTAVTGTNRSVLTGLTAPQRAALAELVDGVGSLHTGGGSLDVAFGPMTVLRDHGVKAVLVVPVRADGTNRGVLVVTSSRSATVSSQGVEAVEVLGLHIGTTLASRAQLEQMQVLAYRDPLTGTANRTVFEQVLSANDAAASGSGPRSWLALFDVDRFKQINDRFGHAAGDATLRSLADALQSRVRAGDHVFRLGGDEFAVLLADVDETMARETMRRLANSCLELLAPVGAGLSGGLAELSPDRPAAAALASADHELYRCKAAGGLSPSSMNGIDRVQVPVSRSARS
jgi:diguanylate cyclase (GGDEF)-like protein